MRRRVWHRDAAKLACRGETAVTSGACRGFGRGLWRGASTTSFATRSRSLSTYVATRDAGKILQLREHVINRFVVIAVLPELPSKAICILDARLYGRRYGVVGDELAA